MLGFTFFNKAGATGNVFFSKGGHMLDRGLAYSGIVWPTTTVAVVPTTPRIIDFAPVVQTKDKQSVAVTGSVVVTLIPATAISKFDFTVNPKDGAYVSQWEQVLNAKVIEGVLREMLGSVKDFNVEEATRAQKEIETAIATALGGDAFSAYGIKVESCSIASVEPDDEEVAETIGSVERQTMISASDNAIHTRRMNGVTNERTIKQYEADTKVELEKKQAKLLAEQAKNKKTEATADAEATKIRLAPLKDVEAGKLLGAAVMKAAESGRLGSLAITTEFLAAVGK